MAKRVVRGCDTCEECGLCNVGNIVCLMGDGPVPAKIMVVGDAVGFAEDDKGIPFIGKSARMLEELMYEYELDCSEMYFTHAVKCRTPEGKAPSAKEMKACKQYLDKEIKSVNPDYVLLLGATALKTALGKAKITEIHGEPIVKDGITYFPTFSPGIALRDPKKAEPLRLDIKRFSQLLKGKKPRRHKLKLTIVSSIIILKELILEMVQCIEFAYDIETTGLNRFADDAIVTILSIATWNGEWVIPFNLPGSYFSTIESQRLVVELLIKYSKGKMAIAQNGKFDDLYTEVQYGAKFHMGFDTMLAAHLLDENAPQGLKHTARRYLDAHNWDIDLDLKKGQLTGPEHLPKLCEYAAWDVYFTLRLKKVFEKKLKQDESLHRLFHRCVMKVVIAYEKIESHGSYVNLEKMDRIRVQEDKKMAEALINLDELYDEYYRKPWIKRHRKTNIYELSVKEFKKLPTTAPLPKVNWSSASQVKRILFDQLALIPMGFTPKGEPSTAEELVNRMAGQHPILTPLLNYRHAFKLMSSFIDGWAKRLVNGCYLFPGFKVSGTVTGRPSSSDPNLQQVPRNTDIRSQISAPQGWIFFEIDYSQLELRIAAILSGDPEMVRIFQTGGDIHTETATAVSGEDVESMEPSEKKKKRKQAKPVNFGFIYGMGWRKFGDYALDKYQVTLTDDQSQQFRTRYFEKYAGILPWHKRQKRIVAALGQVRTLTGRIRRLPEIESPDQGMRAEAERGAINAPVQGFGAEMGLMALVDLDRELDSSEVKICGTIHDAMVGRVRVDKAYKWIPIIKSIMENPTLLKEFNIDLNLPITADISLGDWGLGDEVESPQEEALAGLDEEGWDWNTSANLFENERTNQMGYFAAGKFKTLDY